MTNTSWQDKAPGGCQPGGQANAADADDYLEGTIIYPKELVEMIEMAKQHKQYVYAAFQVVIDPNGLVYLRRPYRHKPVWVEIQELIDP